jgi:hypothetical protein
MNIANKLILTIIFFAIQALIYSQTEEYFENPLASVTKRNVHEIDFQIPFMVGYSYFHNFGNKFIPGIGVKFGGGLSYGINPYRCGAEYNFDYGFLAEFLEIDLKARDLFSKRKLSRWYSYDFGINYTVIMWEEWVHFLCAKFSFDVKVSKVIRLGLNVKVGDAILNKKNSGFWIFLNPSLVISF